MSKRAGKRTSRSDERRVIPFGQQRPPEPEPPPRPTPPPRALTQEEALEALWSAKCMYVPDAEGHPTRGPDGDYLVNPNWCDVFVYATLRKDVEVETQYPKKPRTITAGTRVLVTMVSRFGHVGIRDTNLVPASNGYCAAVGPEDLTDWNMAP